MPRTNFPAAWMENATRAALDPRNDNHGTDGHIAHRLWAMAEGSPVAVYVVGEDTEGGYAARTRYTHHFTRSAARAECVRLIRKYRAEWGSYPRRGYFKIESFNVFP